MKSKKTGLTYPEPTIPPQAELYQCFSTASVGDIVILYIKYKNNISSIYQCFVTHVSQKHIFVTHVSHGFSIQDGKANDKHGTLIEHWQLLPYTEELN